MGRLNIWLPDDLQAEVRQAQLNVSGICQSRAAIVTAGGHVHAFEVGSWEAKGDWDDACAEPAGYAWRIRSRTHTHPEWVIARRRGFRPRLAKRGSALRGSDATSAPL